ncbi:MAG: S46 family peptidase [Bryobacterales bacterium]|nr:S46 family peptidase [Bryobacterales bacterium]MBV9400657.1 S46 family peptidase [Bryobacterales bacterium]
MNLTIRAGVVTSLAFFAANGWAEEGMWTFDNPPVKQLQDKYRFTPTKEWLDHVRLASVRLNDGGSGSFVSPHGLLLTNHHVARGQLQKNSTPEHDYIANGFYAATPDQEIKSPDLEINVLISMEDVTARVRDAVKQAKSAEDQYKSRQAIIAQIERESQQKTGLRSDVVTLYGGGEYWLYRYKKYTDVRIVFAPEQQIAFYGGDPDNFTYPRYDLDMALFRVYENGKPIDSTQYLKWNPKGAADEELVFVSGNPGATSRLDTVAQLANERDTIEPILIKRTNDRIATLKNFAGLGSNQALEAGSRIFNLENSKKVYDGRLRGLKDPAIFGKKQKEEDDFKARVMANPQWKAASGNAWQEIADAQKKAVSRVKEQFFRDLDSTLASYAGVIVQYVAEVKKPDGERLPGYHDSQLESLKFRLLSKAPVYRDLEIATMTGALELSLSELGASDPFVKAVLEGRTPTQAATELVTATKLTDAAVRQQLLDGGEAAVMASNDPMIVLARKLDPMRRELIKWNEQNVTSVVQRAGEQLGRARFDVYGKSTYPDATFTLRLSYGQMKGYPMNGTIAPYKTTLFGLYDRANSFNFQEPFDLPARYKEGKSKLDLSTPMNFVSTNDIIGGNSGSPVINRNGEIVGLIFDGNIESLVGDFVYDIAENRAVAVHTSVMTEVLTKLYGAQKLVDELLNP